MEQEMEEKTEEKNEKKMSKKKRFTLVGVIVGVIVVAAAAFIGGRLLNQQASSLGMLSPGGVGGAVAMSVEIVPAPELPTTAPEVNGTFAERQNSSIYIQTFSMDMGNSGGVVVQGSGPSSDTSSGPVTSSSNSNTGPKVEVVVTNSTKIFADVTQMPTNSGEGTTKIQQVVAPGNLDDLTTQTMVQVWGRKVSDRVIADVILYSNPIVIKHP